MSKLSKEKILDATFEILEENDLSKLSISVIANKLNCSKSSIYHHFESKDQLIKEVYISNLSEINKAFKVEKSLQKTIENTYKRLFEEHNRFVFMHKYSSLKFTKEDFKEHINLKNEFIKQLSEHQEINKNLSEFSIEALFWGPIMHITMSCHHNPTKRTSSREVKEVANQIYLSLKKEN